MPTPTVDPLAAPAAPLSIPATILRKPGISDDSPHVLPGDSLPRWSFIQSEPHRVAPFPIALNYIVQRYVDRILAHPGGLILSFERSRPYLRDMVRVLQREGLPRDLVYLAFAESDFSKRGAGPWQLTKATARRFGLTINKFVDERRDPIMSTRAAAEYLAALKDQTDDWRVALIGWNEGGGAIDKYESLRGTNYKNLVAHLPAPTRGLLNRFMAVAIIAHHARAYGLQAVTFTIPPPYRQVRVQGGTRLHTIAQHYDTSVHRLHELNPALLKDRVPPHVRSFPVRVPLRENASLSDSNQF